MKENKIVIENTESTVVAKYDSIKAQENEYQSEAELEKAFIKQLENQAYEYLALHTEKDLIQNLKKQIEKLNSIEFNDNEWDRFFNNILANNRDGIEEKTFIIQENNIHAFEFDNGVVKNITIFDKGNVHNNSLQVINQYETETTERKNRYDVSILVNGLPLVHVELKRRGIPIREAFNQINRYQRESFWSGSGLFEYVQIFVISNGTQTKYYSNTTRNSHIKEINKTIQKGQSRQTSNSFEFTSWWADETNEPILDLRDFTKTFFAKHTLLNILAKYCIFTSEKMLMVMRPYQICATEKIINRIFIAHNNHYEGKKEAGGYIWHTTGSGKTLTSFKTARIATSLDFVEKVVFVVDRKDLDYQTMKEYDRFEKGAANGNSSSDVLRKQLKNNSSKLIITTIQKLSAMLKNKTYEQEIREITNKNIVFIFDECHRSQFGQMHKDITRKFKKYYIFGFTGTPIFTQNATSNNSPTLQTTQQAFGDKLHTYTIVDAIRDKNVLPFRVEYVSTLREKKDFENIKVWSIDTERALKDERRIELVTKYIIEHFNQKTKRDEKAFAFNKITNIHEVASAKDRNNAREIKQTIRMKGFNSIFAVASIDFAKLYYEEFKKQNKGLKVATIFSYGVNNEQDEAYGFEDENNENTEGLTLADRDFLENAIKDYNKMFGTNYDTSSEKFQNYYKDVSLRTKNREIDLLIVVNMFLTGFDATTLNTLWTDKNLRMHGLLQAYSRTNRVLNSIKTFGNIVCFRNLEQATNDAIALFGNKEACGLVLLKTFEEYYKGYIDDKGNHIKGYKEIVNLLLENYPTDKITKGEEAKRLFVKLFGALLKVQNILQAFDQFAGQELLTERQMQDYLGLYNDIYQETHAFTVTPDKEKVNEDLIFEMELVKQVEINIDYILELVKKYQKEQEEENKEIILQDIDRAVRSSPQMRDKKDLIDDFVKTITPTSNVDDDWNTFVHTRLQEEMQTIIKTENLNEDEARGYIKNCFNEGYVKVAGTEVANILPPSNPFKVESKYEQKKQNVIDKIKTFFNRFYDLVGSNI